MPIVLFQHESRIFLFQLDLLSEKHQNHENSYMLEKGKDWDYVSFFLMPRFMGKIRKQFFLLGWTSQL